MFSTVFGPIPWIASSCSGVIPPNCSTVPTPASTSFSSTFSLSPWSSSTETGAPGTTSVAISDSTSCRFSSSLLMSIRQPNSLAASRTFWPFLPMARESCVSSTITSICFPARSTIVTLAILAGLSALVTKTTGSSE